MCYDIYCRRFGKSRLLDHTVPLLLNLIVRAIVLVSSDDIEITSLSQAMSS